MMIANLSAGLEGAQAILFDCQLFNCFGDDPLNEVLRLEAFRHRCISLNDLIPGASTHLRGGPGWIYTVAREPQLAVLHYESVRGPDSIAVCHAF